MELKLHYVHWQMNAWMWSKREHVNFYAEKRVKDVCHVVVEDDFKRKQVMML